MFTVNVIQQFLVASLPSLRSIQTTRWYACIYGARASRASEGEELASMANLHQGAGYRAFLTHLDTLRTAITDPGHLATQLYAKGLLTPLAHQRAQLASLAPLERSQERGLSGRGCCL